MKGRSLEGATDTVYTALLPCYLEDISSITSLLSKTYPFWAADPKGTMSYRTEGGIYVRPSVGGRSSLRGEPGGKGGGLAGGLEQGSWGLGRVSKGLGG